MQRRVLAAIEDCLQPLSESRLGCGSRGRIRGYDDRASKPEQF
jgi:hypothetical protein